MSPMSTVGLTISGNTPKANCLNNVRYCCRENMTSFHLFDKSCGAERGFPGQQSCVYLQLIPPGSSWAGRSGRHFPAGEKINIALKQSLANSQTAMLSGVLLQVAFVLQVRDGERSVGDSEEGLSHPRGLTNLRKTSQSILRPYSR